MALYRSLLIWNETFQMRVAMTILSKALKKLRQAMARLCNRFDFIQDSIVEVLSDMGFMSEAAARNWCEKATEPYSISIEDFAKLVKEYIDHKGNNHHVVFWSTRSASISVRTPN